jgi:hypothetical protein
MKDTGKSGMGEFWADVREHDAQHKQTMREGNTKAAEYYAAEYGLLLTSFNGGMQLRFTKNGLKIDYFPTSDKIKIGDRFFKADLETTLKTHFNL